MRARSVAALVLPLLAPLASGSAHASDVSFRPLGEVVAKSPLVFDAEVAKATRSSTKQEMKMAWQLTDLHVIRGTLPATTRAAYVEIIPIMYDDKGNVVGSFSPILDASGQEWSATKGRFIFLSNGSVTADGIFVSRVEPMAKLADVTAALPEAGAPVPPTPQPQPAPSSEPAPPPAVQPSRGCRCDLGAARGDFFPVMALGALVMLVRRRR